MRTQAEEREPHRRSEQGEGRGGSEVRSGITVGFPEGGDAPADTREELLCRWVRSGAEESGVGTGGEDVGS